MEYARKRRRRGVQRGGGEGKRRVERGGERRVERGR